MARKREPLTDEEFERQYQQARIRARVEAATEPRAASVEYRAEDGRFHVELTSGCLVAIPAASIDELEDATAEQLAKVEAWPSGVALEWPELDVQLYLPSLLAEVLQLRKVAARMLGARKTERKAAASRANGAKGGRPRKRPAGASEAV